MFSFFKRDQLLAVRLGALLAFVIPMLLTQNLWLSDRGFPVVPLFEGIPIPNFTIDILLIVLFFICFAFFVKKPTWKVGLPIVMIFCFWAMVDQNRLQPYFFEIIFVVLALSLFMANVKVAKQCLLLIFIGTYFWSGIHKYNDLFFEKWLNGLNKRIPFVPNWIRLVLTYSIPFLEATFGLLLISSKTRKMGIWFIACMHTIILATFLIGNYGYSIFPLTIFNVGTLFYVFYNDKMRVKEVFNAIHPKKIGFIVLVILFPSLNLIGKYDHILSFSYFSGKPKYCRVDFFNKAETLQLPLSIQKNVREYNGLYYIDLNEWGWASIGVLVYPEARVHNYVHEYINKHIESPKTKLSYY